MMCICECTCPVSSFIQFTQAESTKQKSLVIYTFFTIQFTQAESTKQNSLIIYTFFTIQFTQAESIKQNSLVIYTFFIMQLAVNIIVFGLGFLIATLVALRPKRARTDLENFTSNLRHVTDGLMEGFRVHGHLNRDDENEHARLNTAGKENLLTK